MKKFILSAIAAAATFATPAFANHEPIVTFNQAQAESKCLSMGFEDIGGPFSEQRKDYLACIDSLSAMSFQGNALDSCEMTAEVRSNSSKFMLGCLKAIGNRQYDERELDHCMGYNSDGDIFKCLGETTHGGGNGSPVLTEAQAKKLCTDHDLLGIYFKGCVDALKAKRFDNVVLNLCFDLASNQGDVVSCIGKIANKDYTKFDISECKKRWSSSSDLLACLAKAENVLPDGNQIITEVCKAMVDLDWYRTCQNLAKYNNFQKVAVQVCSDRVFWEENQVICLDVVSNKRFHDAKEVTACGDKVWDADVISCLRNLRNFTYYK